MMFQGIVASILNRYLGKYIQNLDIQSLNVGIFGGNVELEALRLKPEALYELGLPIEIKLGTVGKFSLKIPWNKLCNQSIILNMEEIFLLTGPITDGKYCPEIEKCLIRAAKRKILEDLEGESIIGYGGLQTENLIEVILTTIINNLRIYIHNIHIRYEDGVTNSQLPVSLGVCLQDFTLETTNANWKPINTCSKSSVYQIIKIESFSLYCNPGSGQLLLRNDLLINSPDNWFACMRKSLETFSINGELLNCVMKPISLKVKVIVNKSNNAHVSKVLLDFVLQDVALQLSHQQYLCILQVHKSFNRINVNKEYYKFRPAVSVLDNPKFWWGYAYNSVVEKHIRQYTFKYMLEHRKNYHRYCAAYKKMVLNPSDTEIKLDLQQIEDLLDIHSIVVAREQSKLELHRLDPNKIMLTEEESGRSWFNANNNMKIHKLVIVEKCKTVSCLLSHIEKTNLYKLIGCKEKFSPNNDKSKNYFEYKINFTLMYLNFSLISGGKEIAVLSLSRLLSSVESRPLIRSYKLSTRIENILIEGISVEYLLPIVIGKKVVGGDKRDSLWYRLLKKKQGGRPGDFLTIDFEKHPPNSNADYSFTVLMEPIQIFYNEFATSALLSFLHTPFLNREALSQFITTKMKELLNMITCNTINRNTTVQFSINMGLPYVVIPECGSLDDEKCSTVIIIDCGYLGVQSEIQAASLSLEDTTKLELEEKLYDRYHMKLYDLVIFMLDREEYKNIGNGRNYSAYTILKMRPQVVFSNSIKHEYRSLPKYKLNITFQTVSLHLSDDRITKLLNFLLKTSMAKSHTILDVSDFFAFDKILHFPRIDEFENVQDIIAKSEIRKKCVVKAIMDSDVMKLSSLTVDKSVGSSEMSDEDLELWAKTLDLPGFDDNVSPHNAIVTLFRFHIAQVNIELIRTSVPIDKPYVVFTIGNLCCDTAFMEFGSAIQFSIGSISLVDKLHRSLNSNRIQLISTSGQPDVITLLYRKVQSDCPDFKSHFHNVEQSLVIDVHCMNLTFHGDALIDLHEYLKYIWNKLQNHKIPTLGALYYHKMKRHYQKFIKSNGPPIPSGATKFSYSVRITETNLQLNDDDADYIRILVNGFEVDSVFKANEKMVFRSYLRSLTIEDCNNNTLHQKLLSTEDDHVFEVKFVRHSPRLYHTSIYDNNKDDVKSDGSLKLNIRRMNVVISYKSLYDIQKFLSRFVTFEYIYNNIIGIYQRICYQLSMIRTWKTRIHLSIDCQMPSLLLPKKYLSPDLIILNMGDLTIENFFNEKEMHPSHIMDSALPVIDNILVKLECISMSRAIITFDNVIIVQEAMLDPIRLTIDAKRTISYSQFANNVSPDSAPTFPLLLWKTKAVMDVAHINIGQKDISTIVEVWEHNVNRIYRVFFAAKVLESMKTHEYSQTEDNDVKKLQAFFNKLNPVLKESEFLFTFDGLHLCLYRDITEVLSSPIRNMNLAICKLSVEDIKIQGKYYTDDHSELDLSVQFCLLEDMRPSTSTSFKKIFESHISERFTMETENIYVAPPPVLNITTVIVQAETVSRNAKIDLNFPRFNLCISFLVDFIKFFDNITPTLDSDNNTIKLINFGYFDVIEKLKEKVVATTDEHGNLYISNDLVDFIPQAKAKKDLSLSIECCKLEIMLFTERQDAAKKYAFRLQSALCFYYCRSVSTADNNYRFVVTDFTIIQKPQFRSRLPSHLVMCPCNIEVNKKVHDGDFTITCSPVDIHISATTVNTFRDILEDMHSYENADDVYSNANDSDYLAAKDLIPSLRPSISEDIWKPKQLKLHNFQAENQNKFAVRKFFRFTKLGLVTVTIPNINIVLEMEDIFSKLPVLLINSSFAVNVKKTEDNVETRGDISIQCSCYNSSIGCWEPIIEPYVENENKYYPWNFVIKIFKSRSFPISTMLVNSHRPSLETSKSNRSKQKLSSRKNSEINETESETSADELDSPNKAMRFIRKSDIDPLQTNSQFDKARQFKNIQVDSESDDEDIAIGKLRTTFNQLLIRDSSAESDSDTDTDKSSTDYLSDTMPDSDHFDANKSVDPNCLLSKAGAPFDKEDSFGDVDEEKCDGLYIVVESQRRLEMTLSDHTIGVIKQLLDSFGERSNSLLPTSTKLLSVKNDLYPESTVQLISKSNFGPTKILMSASYCKFNSELSSPASTLGSGSIYNVHSPTDSEYSCSAPSSPINAQNVLSEETRGKPFENMIVNALQFPQEYANKIQNKVIDQQLQIYVNGFELLAVICPLRTVAKCHVLSPKKNDTVYHLIMCVECDLWGRTITVRSPMQIRNETSYSIGLYYNRNSLDKTDFDQIGKPPNPFESFNRFAIVEPDETYNVPLAIAYHCVISILPAYGDAYHISEDGISWWESAEVEYPKDIICKSKEAEHNNSFSVRAIKTTNDYIASNCATSFVLDCLIRLLPLVVIQNYLPRAINIKIPSIQYENRVEAGEKTHIYSLDLSERRSISIEVSKYFGLEWSGSFQAWNNFEEKIISLTTDSDTDGGNKHLMMNVKLEKNESYNFIFYSPYWIVNKTTYPLQLKASQADVVFEASADEVIFFSYRKAQRRRRVRIRVFQSSWSSAFSLESAGCSGLIVCKDRVRNCSYHIILKITLSDLSPHLTKIVTLSPYFFIINETGEMLRYMEVNEDADLWLDIAPKEVLPLFPRTASMKLCVKFVGGSIISQQFSINSCTKTVLRMDRGRALVVEVTGGSAESFFIILRNYKQYDVPVRIDNFCEDLFLKLVQNDSEQVTVLSPQYSVLYTWYEPIKERKLIWNVYNNKGDGFLAKFGVDGYGQETIITTKQVELPSNAHQSSIKQSKFPNALKKLASKISNESNSEDEVMEADKLPSVSSQQKSNDKIIVYWVSYLDKLQRVLLFTQDKQIASSFRSRIDKEISNIDFMLSFKGVGLSLIAAINELPQELAYCSINDSSSIWEVNIANNWKILPLELASWIEHQYQSGLKNPQIKEYVQVDFEKMRITKPFFGDLRRGYNPGITIIWRKSSNYAYMQWKIHKLQVDNQLANGAFSTAVSPTAVSRDTIRKQGLTPCLKGAFLKKALNDYSNIYKYIKIDIHEFRIQLDLEFLLRMYKFIEPLIHKESSSSRSRADICTIHHPLSIKLYQSYKNLDNFIEYIYISPLKFQFNFTLQRDPRSVVQDVNSVYSLSVLQHIYESLHSSFSTVEGLKLYWQFFEEFNSQTSVTRKIKDIGYSYFRHFLLQIYVIVLGINVLTNPNETLLQSVDKNQDVCFDVALLRSRSTDEYAKTIEGAIYNLLSYTVESSSNDIVLYLTSGKRFQILDDEPVKYTTPVMSSSNGVPDEILRNDKCFEFGVVFGLSGVYMNSTAGNRANGQEVFFKTVGKDLLRLLTSHGSVAFNLSAAAIDGVQRAAETGEDIVFRRRLPRYINPFFGLKPFSHHEAIGLNFMNAVKQSTAVDARIEKYWAHVVLKPSGQECLLITTFRVFYMLKLPTWTEWRIGWSFRIDHILDMVKTHTKLIFKLQQEEKSTKYCDEEKYIEHDNEILLEWIQKKVQLALLFSMENKRCSPIEI